VLSTLPQKGDVVFYDELSHACIKEGIRLSFAEKFSFKHNDLDDLKRKLEKCNAKTIYVAVESIYSMDGDESPLLAITELCKKFNAIIIVDEAHSTAHLGSGGNGLVCQLGLEKEIPIRIHTYGKALGCHGATVIAPKVITDYLINFARPFIYTTALPLHSLVNIKMAYQYLSSNNEEVNTLNNNIALFKSLTNTLPKVESNSPIQAILIPGNEEVKTTATNLQKAGFDIRPIMSPTVKEGGERLRICIHTYNTEKQITELCGLLNKLISK
jgi:8-amino-7-oxononanoate synthase